MTEKATIHAMTHLKIFMVIIITAVVIVTVGLAVGAVFQTQSITNALEDNLWVAVDIANEFVSNEIALLKITAAEAARDIRLSYEWGRAESALENVSGDFPEFIGFALFSESGLISSRGIPAAGDLIQARFMQTALSGGQSMSTTMHAPDGTFVMYVSAPVGNGLVLAAALPGLYFSEKVSQFVFLKSGHLFIDDDEGTIIANIRSQWVEQRVNFINDARTDSSRQAVSEVLQRGLAGESGTGFFTMGGVPRICAFRPLSGSNEGWFLGIIAPLNESALKDIPRGIILIASIMLLLSIISAIVASRILKRNYEEIEHLRMEAEVASISKSTFLANMSHEIRTPMNSVMGFSELALDNELPPKIREYLVNIRSNTEWLLEIINDILDLSKIESGKMELENIPFDLHELFNSCRTLIMPKVTEKGLVMHFYAEPSLGKQPIGDPTRLRQVFINLLSNAVKFTNSGIIKLHSTIKRIENNTVCIYFEVRDSGIGMTPEQIDRIFEPFVQAESGTMRKYGGSGLGLAIAKNIIELMGGKLSVESTPGVGSKFNFELTFRTMDFTNEAKAEQIAFNIIEKPVFIGEILLCEDNVMNQQVICEHLDRVGLQTVIAENGKIGVDLVKSRMESGEKQFDLIFMDMHMPVMDGLEAAAKIMELGTNIPVVAMTANIMSNDMDMYRKSGMNDCVGKPFTSQELWRCLMKYFIPINWNTEDSAKLEMRNTDLQQKMINGFVKSNRDLYEVLKSVVDSGDIKLAHRLVHTLKSNAGQLNKIMLQKAAEAVENNLRDGENRATSAQFESLRVELNAVLAELTPLVYETSRPSAAVLHNKSDALELLRELSPLLKEGNSESLKLIERLRTIPGSEELIQQIEDFDFELALETLLKLEKDVLK